MQRYGPESNSMWAIVGDVENAVCLSFRLCLSLRTGIINNDNEQQQNS